jgi:hypothetical protein
VRSWRNWQTHCLEVAAGAIPWRFKSSRPHHRPEGFKVAGRRTDCSEWPTQSHQSTLRRFRRAILKNPDKALDRCSTGANGGLSHRKSIRHALCPRHRRYAPNDNTPCKHSYYGRSGCDRKSPRKLPVRSTIMPVTSGANTPANWPATFCAPAQRPAALGPASVDVTANIAPVEKPKNTPAVPSSQTVTRGST